MEELSQDMTLAEHRCKIYTHPDHELIGKVFNFYRFLTFFAEADMADLEMIDRAVLPGDIVRKTGQTPLGTVLNVKTISKIRVLETSKFIGEVDCARLRKV